MTILTPVQRKGDRLLTLNIKVFLSHTVGFARVTLTSTVDNLGCSIDTMESVSKIRRRATPSISTEILGAPCSNRTETENRLTALSGPLKWKELSVFSPPIRFPDGLSFPSYLPSLLRIFQGERFNLRKLKELQVKEKYQIGITNRFAALENLNVDEDVNRIWENIKRNIKTSAKESLGLYEWKQHKQWFDKECVDFLDQRKHAKMQWIQDPSRSNVDNLNNIRRDANRHFRNKKKAYLKV